MTATRNAQLIDAVEAGREEEVKSLVEAGASPDARKRVTLRAKVDDGHGGFEWREDSENCESSLALAILHARVGIVTLLLEKGARVDTDVTWRIAHGWIGAQTWTNQEWDRQRWISTVRFPSALCLAMAVGGTVTLWNGGTDDRPNSKGQLALSPTGGTITLNHPAKDEDVYVWPFPAQPTVEIVRLLLAYGAPVGDAELSAARKSTDQVFLRTLESHQRSPIPRPGKSPLELANAAHAAQVQELTERVAAAEARAAAAEERARVAERKLAKSDRHSSSHQSSTLALDEEVSSLRRRVLSLEHDNALLHEDVITLRQEGTALRQEITALRANNTALVNEVTSLQLGAGQGPPTPPPHGHSHRSSHKQKHEHPLPRTPVTKSVHRMMFAISHYESQSADEIGFMVGDMVFVELAYADGWGSGYHTTTQSSGVFPLALLTSDPPGTVPGTAAAPPEIGKRIDSLHQIGTHQGSTSHPSSSRSVSDVVGPPRSVKGSVNDVVGPPRSSGRVGGRHSGSGSSRHAWEEQEQDQQEQDQQGHGSSRRSQYRNTGSGSRVGVSTVRSETGVETVGLELMQEQAATGGHGETTGSHRW